MSMDAQHNAQLAHNQRPGFSLEPMATVEEVAEFLRMKPFTIRKMARLRELPARRIGGKWRFFWPALRRFVERR